MNRIFSFFLSALIGAFALLFLQGEQVQAVVMQKDTGASSQLVIEHLRIHVPASE